MQYAAQQPTSADACAEIIFHAFLGYNADFHHITSRAKQRFEERDWEGGRQDVVERIELYDTWINRTTRSVYENARQ